MRPGKAAAAFATVLLMALLLWSGVRRSGAPGRSASSRSEEVEPAEARIHALLRAAWDGDVETYLGSFDGPLRQRLEREVAERGRNAFAADLKVAARARKSHAVFAVEPESETAARVTVETVYPDRNERQTYHLTGASGGCLVTEVETIRSRTPTAKFGAPATYQEPEGVPVQSGVLNVETGEAETP